jgi:hypothetical protein
MERCKVCYGLQLVDNSVPQDISPPGTFVKGMQKSAHQGCFGCTLLCDGIARCIPSALYRRRVGIMHGPTLNPGNPPRLNIGLSFEDEKDRLEEIEFFIPKGGSRALCILFSDLSCLNRDLGGSNVF